MSGCTCGASGGIDGHWWTCDLRQPLSISTPEPQPSVAQVIHKIPQQRQAQYGLEVQLSMLNQAAVKLGLYDANDYLNSLLKDWPR